MSTILLICPEEFVIDKDALSIIDLNVISDSDGDEYHLEASFVVNIVDDDLKRLPMNHFEFVYVGESCAHIANVADPSFLTSLLKSSMRNNSYVFLNSNDIDVLVKYMKKHGFERIKSSDIKKKYNVSGKEGFLFQKNVKTIIHKDEMCKMLGTNDKEYIKFLKDSWVDMNYEEWKEIAEIKRNEYEIHNAKTLDNEWIGLYNLQSLFIIEEEGKKFAFTHQDLYKVLMGEVNPFTGQKLTKQTIKDMRDVVFFGSYSLSLKEAVKDLFS